MEFVDWGKLSHAERTEAIQAVPDPLLFTKHELAIKKEKQTEKLLEKNSQAQRLCHCLAIGFFLLNTPEQMAAYCIAEAEKNGISD